MIWHLIRSEVLILAHTKIIYLLNIDKLFVQ